MKYPTYISEMLMNETGSLYRKIRQRDGMEAAALFKRISLVAAYGSMYGDKITYRQFLKDAEEYFWGKRSFIHFWGLKQDADNRKYTPDTFKVFYVMERTIVYAPMEELEKEIIQALKQRLGYIKTSLKDDYCQIIHSYETRRNK
jgi:hypothetical protein